MDFASDLALMLADFGTPGTLAGVAVCGVYDAPGAVALGMVTTEPTYLLPSTQVPTPSQGLALVLPGVGNFTVRHAMADDPGLTRIELQKAAP
jgi:hypothetical protein